MQGSWREAPEGFYFFTFLHYFDPTTAQERGPPPLQAGEVSEGENVRRSAACLSLRLGHGAALTAHRAAIHSRADASRPCTQGRYPSGKSAQDRFPETEILRQTPCRGGYHVNSNMVYTSAKTWYTLFTIWKSDDFPTFRSLFGTQRFCNSESTRRTSRRPAPDGTLCTHFAWSRSDRSESGQTAHSPNCSP